jgi:hypothetical protein
MRYHKSTNSLDSLVKRQDVQMLKHLPKNLSSKLSVETENLLNEDYVIDECLTHPTYPFPVRCTIWTHLSSPQLVALGIASRIYLHRMLKR